MTNIPDRLPWEPPADPPPSFLAHFRRDDGSVPRQALDRQHVAGYAAAALAAEEQAVRDASEGTRNDTLNRAAFNLGQLVAAGQLDELEVRDRLFSAGVASGLTVQETWRTIESGLIAGTRQPRRLSSASEPNPSNLPTWGGSYVDELRQALVDTDGLDGLPTLEPVVAGVLYADSLAWLQGKPGHGKSFVALDVAGCVATGETWQGNPTTAGTVVYVIAEGAAGLRPRVRAWEKSYGHPMSGVWFLPVAVQSASAGAWDGLVWLVTELRPVLVVIDTQARVTVGRDENSAQDMGEFVAALDRLRKATGACVLVVHHQGRNGEHMRGSTALEGAATTILRTEKDSDVLTVSCAKQKDGPEFDRFTLRLVPTGESVVPMLDDGQERPERTVERCRPWLGRWRETFADEWVSVTTLTESGVIAKNTFHANRLKLLDAKAIERIGEGRTTRYRVVSHES